MSVAICYGVKCKNLRHILDALTLSIIEASVFRQHCVVCVNVLLTHIHSHKFQFGVSRLDVNLGNGPKPLPILIFVGICLFRCGGLFSSKALMFFGGF